MGSCPFVRAQADLRIQVARTNQDVEVSWTVKTLVPPPGVGVFASYLIFASSNLVDWRVVSARIDGLELADEKAHGSFPLGQPQLFFKVESLLDFHGQNVMRLRLDRGNLEGATFAGCDFFGASLNEANLGRANLQATDFRFASMIDANLRGADLRGADFSNANLTRAKLQGALASFVDFTGANLTEADFAGADLRFTSLLDAQIDFIGLQNTIIDEETLLDPKTRLIWELVNGRKVGATISNELLAVSNFREADLRNTKWIGTDIRGSDLAQADLTGANLMGARLEFASFRGTIIDESTTMPEKWRLVWRLNNEDFSGANLSGRDLSNAALAEVRLAGAVLTNANMQQ